MKFHYKCNGCGFIIVRNKVMKVNTTAKCPICGSPLWMAEQTTIKGE